MSILVGDITRIELWGFDEGEWWEVGSGAWSQESGALRGEQRMRLGSFEGGGRLRVGIHHE